VFDRKRLTTCDQIHDSGSGMDHSFNKPVYRHTKSSVLSYVVNLTILVHGCAEVSLP
jgi:hypothetical protein